MKIGLTGILLLEARFAHSVDPLALRDEGEREPENEVELSVELLRGEIDNTYAVKLHVSSEGHKTRYSFAVTYAALITVTPEDGEQVPADFDQRLTVTGAGIVFPYARELVSSMTARGQYGPVWLNPVNFSQAFGPKKQEAGAPTE